MCEIEIDPERLKHFPQTVPMNIREAILVVAHVLNRIQTGKATKETAEEEIPKPAPVPTASKRATNTKVPAKRRGRPPRSPQKKAIHCRARTIFFSES